jgi:flavin reductase (DIM6/NTAB) family NADH-FMN oxidoreductase RutF
MSIDGRHLRDALGRFATGVCVITTGDEGKPVAMTVNSFASVSLAPPLILWSLQNNSDLYHRFSAPKHFAVNVLAKEQKELANLYAKKGGHILQDDHYRLGKYGSPVIRNALTTLECQLESSHDGGDHLIIIGRVRDMHTRPTGLPLLFFSGAYRELH